jgi:hypothetical protein
MSEAILGFLRANAEQLDVDMAEALNIPLAELRDEIARLAAAGDVICCKVTRFIEGRKIEGISLPLVLRSTDTGARAEAGGQEGRRRGSPCLLRRLAPGCDATQGQRSIVAPARRQLPGQIGGSSGSLT